ncbi:MAG: TIGR00730 family Rossman fold protein [Planctomycetota bacterium]|nr:TIGR00730 family Rossman fold protein [Planctomycetota bacterium]MDA1106536.1 TIGR00730 family Rossman fold protein [Planctomycetota bacterium]
MGRSTGSIKRVTVYCGSATGTDPAFLELARLTGEAIAGDGLELVYGGGGIGLMGELARAAKGAGGRVTGIITEQFLKLEQGWTGCDELVVLQTMAQRKHELIKRADAFLVLPGGLGTYEEFFETLVGRVIGRHPAPIGLIDTGSFFEPLEALLDHAVSHGFARAAARACVVRGTCPRSVLRQCESMLGMDHDVTALLPMHGRGAGT